MKHRPDCRVKLTRVDRLRLVVSAARTDTAILPTTTDRRKHSHLPEAGSPARSWLTGPKLAHPPEAGSPARNGPRIGETHARRDSAGSDGTTPYRPRPRMGAGPNVVFAGGDRYAGEGRTRWIQGKMPCWSARYHRPTPVRRRHRTVECAVPGRLGPFGRPWRRAPWRFSGNRSQATR